MAKEDATEGQGSDVAAQGASEEPSGGITKDSPILHTGDQPKDQGSEAKPKVEQGSDTALKALEAKLAELEKDNARYRRQAREREEQDQKEKDAKLSEAERFAKEAQQAAERAAKLEETLRQERLSTAAVAAAQARGFHSPNAVLKRLSEFTSVEYDEDGKPNAEQVGKVIEALVSDEPYLVGTGGSPGNPAREGGGSGESDAEKRARIFGGGVGVPADPNSLPGGGVVVSGAGGIAKHFSFGDRSEG